MKKLGILLVILSAFAIVRHFKSSRPVMSHPEIAPSEAQTPQALPVKSGKHEAIRSVVRETAQRDQNGESSNFQSPNELLTPGLERFSVNRDLEGFISKLPMSIEARKLLLSGMIVQTASKENRARDLADVLSPYLRELHSHQKEFVEGLRSLPNNEKDFPPGFQEGLMSIASNLGSAPSKEVQELALSQIEKLKAAGDFSAKDASTTLAQSIASFVFASKDQNAALEKIQKTIDLNDSNQMDAFQEAKTMLQFNGQSPSK